MILILRYQYVNGNKEGEKYEYGKKLVIKQEGREIGLFIKLQKGEFIMNFEEFRQYIKDNLKSFLSEAFYPIDVIDSDLKRDDIVLNGITVISGDDKHETNIYIDNIYKMYARTGKVETAMDMLAYIIISDRERVSNVKQIR